MAFNSQLTNGKGVLTLKISRVDPGWWGDDRGAYPTWEDADTLD